LESVQKVAICVQNNSAIPNKSAINNKIDLQLKAAVLQNILKNH